MSAIDLTVLPFTHELKEQVWSKNAQLRASAAKFPGAWEKSFSPSELVAMMDDAGIESALLPAHTGGSWAAPYETIAEMAASYPGRIHGMAGIDPRDIEAGVRKLEYGVRELGFVGAHSYPHWFGLPPDDRVWYPFYLRCVELGVPMQIQIGQAFQPGLRNIGHPSALDAICVDFPSLKVIAIHTGYPWERELVALAWKHDNLYVGADTLHPRDWAPELVAFIAGAGREKVMFGTNYPAVDFADAVAGVRALDLEPATEELLLHGNVRRVYGLGAPTTTERGVPA